MYSAYTIYAYLCVQSIHTLLALPVLKKMRKSSVGGCTLWKDKSGME